MSWLVALCLFRGVCVEPTDTAQQKRLREELLLREWIRIDPETHEKKRATCQNALFSSCPPVIYDS